MEAPVTRQPLLHLGMFVGGIVIRDQVDFLTGWCDLVDHAEKFQPLLVAMTIVAVPLRL